MSNAMIISNKWETERKFALWLFGALLFASFVCPPRPPSLTVYVFLNTECPISQQYVRTLSTLHKQYAVNATFVALFPSKTDSPRLVQQFRNEYGLSFAGKPDVKTTMARQLRAHVTPEVVVLDATGRVRYRGAIDNYFFDLGKHRPAATQHYLRDALNELLANEAVAVPETEAVGCLIE